MPIPAIRKIILCIRCFIDDELLLLLEAAGEEALCFAPLPLAIPLPDVTESGDGLVWCGKRRLAKGCLLLLLFDFFLTLTSLRQLQLISRHWRENRLLLLLFFDLFIFSDQRLLADFFIDFFVKFGKVADKIIFLSLLVIK